MTKYRIKKTPRGWRVYVYRVTGDLPDAPWQVVNTLTLDSWEACRQTVWNSLSARFRG